MPSLFLELIVDTCPKCKRPMIPASIHKLTAPYHNSIERQAKLVNACLESKIYSPPDGKFICTDCSVICQITFKCDLCKKEQKISEVKESFGYPAEYLCKTCYETQPAKVWEKRQDELEEAHRYDWE